MFEIVYKIIGDKTWNTDSKGMIRLLRNVNPWNLLTDSKSLHFKTFSGFFGEIKIAFSPYYI